MAKRKNAIEVICAVSDPILGTTYKTTPMVTEERIANATVAYQEALNRANKVKAKKQRAQHTKHK
ncbi:MAG: hypothetical protein J6R22_05020 [Alphaproteobacteria bacterium]|nr:hypothetical protein [Alphaproteobacteria bacterium]